jgi:c-di-GMP-binding flagellar brake protein YcgR
VHAIVDVAGVALLAMAVVVDLGDQSLAISAEILGVKDSNTLELMVKDVISHTQSRNFFRVDASTRVAASSIVLEELAQEGENWRFFGDTLDLSGSGLLCSFNVPIEQGTKVMIELTLPTGSMETITALGHVVRCKKIGEELYHVGLHFDSIDSDSQDKIMACCFEIQRQGLRLRVKVRKGKEYS